MCTCHLPPSETRLLIFVIALFPPSLQPVRSDFKARYHSIFLKTSFVFQPLDTNLLLFHTLKSKQSIPLPQSRWFKWTVMSKGILLIWLGWLSARLSNMFVVLLCFQTKSETSVRRGEFTYKVNAMTHRAAISCRVVEATQRQLKGIFVNRLLALCVTTCSEFTHARKALQGLNSCLVWKHH